MAAPFFIAQSLPSRPCSSRQGFAFKGFFICKGKTPVPTYKYNELAKSQIRSCNTFRSPRWVAMSREFMIGPVHRLPGPLKPLVIDPLTHPLAAPSHSGRWRKESDAYRLRFASPAIAPRSTRMTKPMNFSGPPLGGKGYLSVAPLAENIESFGPISSIPCSSNSSNRAIFQWIPGRNRGNRGALYG